MLMMAACVASSVWMFDGDNETSSQPGRRGTTIGWNRTGPNIRRRRTNTSRIRLRARARVDARNSKLSFPVVVWIFR